MNNHQVINETTWLLALVRDEVSCGPTKIPASLKRAAVSHLLSVGADPHFSVWGKTAFSTAVAAQDFETVRFFLRSGVSPNQPERLRSASPLEVALKSGDYVMARILVRAGAVISQEQANECLIEMCGGWPNPQKVIRYLVNKMGAELDAVAPNTREGATPLLIAIRRGDDDLAMFLLDLGADPDFRLGKTRSPYTWVKQNSEYLPLTNAFYKRRELSKISSSARNRNRIVETPVVATRPLM